MEVVWIALITFAAFIGVAVVVAGGVFLFLRIPAREPINLDLRFLVRSGRSALGRGDPGMGHLHVVGWHHQEVGSKLLPLHPGPDFRR